LQHRIGDLAKHIDLKLLVCCVADPHRRGFLISGQPRHDQFRQPALAADAVHDLHLLWTAGDGADEPVAPVARFFVVSEMHECQKREGRVLSQQ